MQGVTIDLTDASNSTITTTTDSVGNYSFSGLKPGAYTVHEEQPSGVFESAANVGTAGGTTQGVDTVSGIALFSGVAGTGYNFAVQDHTPDEVRIRLAATDLNNVDLGSTIAGGQIFWLYAYVKDLRPTSDALGVLSAYTTVMFDPTLFQIVTPITFGPNYQNVENPTGQPTTLSDVGAVSSQIDPGSAEQLLFKVELQAIAATSPTHIATFQSSPADQLPGNPFAVTLFGNTDPTGIPPPVDYEGIGPFTVTAPVFVSIDPSSVTDVTTAGTTTPMNFTIHLSSTLPQDVTVFYTTKATPPDNAVPGTTATTPGADFVEPIDNGQENVGEVTIPANTLSATIPISIIGNPLNEADKTFHLVLTSGTDNLVVSTTNGSAQGTIHSGVPLPTVSIQPASGTEGGNAVFDVTLSAASGQVVTVNYSTQPTNPVSAIPGTDYVTTSSVLTFTPGGPLTEQITVPLLLDANETSARQFQMVLSTTAQSNATLANSVVLGTINPLPESSLSGFVYNDTNGNGVRDPGEAGYAGVTIQLTGVDIFRRMVNLSVVTGSGGSYSFTGLTAGTYIITEVQPSILIEGLDHIGTQGGDASVQDQFFVTLGFGVNGTENDFGEAGVNPSSIWTTTFLG